MDTPSLSFSSNLGGSGFLVMPGMFLNLSAGAGDGTLASVDSPGVTTLMGDGLRAIVLVTPLSGNCSGLCGRSMLVLAGRETVRSTKEVGVARGCAVLVFGFPLNASFAFLQASSEGTALRGPNMPFGILRRLELACISSSDSSLYKGFGFAGMKPTCIDAERVNRGLGGSYANAS